MRSLIPQPELRRLSRCQPLREPNRRLYPSGVFGADHRGHRQKYSRYLPFYESVHGKNRKSSPKDTETRSVREKERNARTNAESLGKRRSTMNSRAAYDEDEVLRKVLEESKHEGGPAVQSENGSRRKRSRDDSEE